MLFLSLVRCIFTKQKDRIYRFLDLTRLFFPSQTHGKNIHDHVPSERAAAVNIFTQLNKQYICSEIEHEKYIGGIFVAAAALFPDGPGRAVTPRTNDAAAVLQKVVAALDAHLSLRRNLPRPR